MPKSAYRITFKDGTIKHYLNHGSDDTVMSPTLYMQNDFGSAHGGIKLVEEIIYKTVHKAPDIPVWTVFYISPTRRPETIQAMGVGEWPTVNQAIQAFRRLSPTANIVKVVDHQNIVHWRLEF